MFAERTVKLLVAPDNHMDFSDTKTIKTNTNHFLNLYFPFPQPDTSSIISSCKSFVKSLDALEF